MRNEIALISNAARRKTMELLLAPQNLPFAIALGVVAILAALQLVMLMVGGAIGLVDGDADLDLDSDGDVGGIGSVLDFLGVGQIPLVLLLLLWSAAFGMGGLVIQSVARSVTGSLLGIWLASAIALVVSLPLLRLSATVLRPILPRDETESVPIESLLGREAQITVGIARRGRPAEAQVKDQFGTAHYVLVEPEQDGVEFPAGSRVLLLKRRDHIFRVISGVERALEEENSTRSN